MVSHEKKGCHLGSYSLLSLLTSFLTSFCTTMSGIIIIITMTNTKSGCRLQFIMCVNFPSIFVFWYPGPFSAPDCDQITLVLKNKNCNKSPFPLL